MRAAGPIVIWCLALGLVASAAAEPPGPDSSHTGALNSSASSPGQGAVAGQAPAGAPTTKSAPQVPGQASADAPTSGTAPQITTDAAYATSATSAVVTGNGNPGGEPTRLRAKYAPSTARWCVSHGAQGKSSRTRAQKLGSGHEMISELSVKLEGLTGETEYCVELVVTNRSGTAHGGQVRFKTTAGGAGGVAQASRSRTSPTSRNPASPSRRPVASSSWPTTAIVAVVALGTTVLGGLLFVAAARLRSRRRDSAPVAG